MKKCISVLLSLCLLLSCLPGCGKEPAETEIPPITVLPEEKPEERPESPGVPNVETLPEPVTVSLEEADFLPLEETSLTLFHQGLIMAFRDGVYGYMDRSGQWVLEPQYLLTMDFQSGGLAAAMENGLWGYIDRSGNWVIAPQFEGAMDFDENGYAVVKSVDTWKLGLIDTTGAWVLEPVYDEISAADENGLRSVIGSGGSSIIDICGNRITHMYDVRPYNFDTSEIVVVSRDGRYGAVDKNGNTVISVRYSDLSAFDAGGLALAAENKKYGFLDVTGEWAIQPVFDGVSRFSSNGPALAVMRELDKATSTMQKRWGYIDRQGRWVLHLDVDHAWEFREGYARVKKNGLYGMIDQQGNYVIEPVYRRLGEMSNGMVWFWENGKIGYLDSSGNVAIPATFTPVYDTAEGFGYDFYADGLAIVQLGETEGIIDKSGNWIIEPVEVHFMTPVEQWQPGDFDHSKWQRM